jgi:hypothetical protein
MRQTLACLVVGCVVLGAAGVARAGTGALAACGNIFVKDGVHCQVQPPGIDCQTRCTPLNMQVSCARQLFTECSPQCTLTVQPTEVQVCADQCVTQCNASPGSFDCHGSCGAKCSADCSAKCSTSTDQASCVASCQGSCAGYCDVDCQGTLPSLSCTDKCQKVCHAYTVAKVNMDCQLQCQTVERYTNCEAKLTGGCQTACQAQAGAVFCDGQFVNANNVQTCIDELKSGNWVVDLLQATGLQSCGDLVGATGCKVEPPGVDCTSKCTPVSVQTTCQKQLFNECAPQCTLQIVPQEVTVCSDSCVTQCNATPGSFDCSAKCGGSCSADCSAKCTGSTNGNCAAACQASCTGYCQADCTAVLPTLTCQEKCQKYCHAVQTAKVNMDCQVKCQTVERLTNCQTKISGGCKTQCATTDGALFCDGKYVSFSGTLQKCLDALHGLSVIIDDWRTKLGGCDVGGPAPAERWWLLLAIPFAALLLRRRRAG